MNFPCRFSIRPIFASCFLLLALVVAGCQPDQAKDIKVYRDILNVKGDDKQADSNQPLSLHQALLLANGQNERLAIAGENYLQALIDRKRAVAGFLPTVGLGAEYNRIDGSDLAAGTPDHQLDTFASARMNLFNGFSDAANLKQKNATIDQQKQLLLDAQESLLIDVASVYYQVLRSEQSTEVLQNSLKLQQERVRDMQARSKAGVARPLDVYQTQASASATRVQWLNARNQVATGRALLAFLLNAPVEGSPLSDNYSVPADTPLPQSLHDSADKNRKDLMAAKAASDAARQHIEIVFGQYYPSVSVNFTAMLSQHPVEGPDWIGILNVNLPIFSAGRIEADVQQGWSQFRQAELARQQLARKVRQEVEASYRDFADSVQRLTELQIQVSAAEQAFTQADQSYNVGFATNLERLTAQDQMLAAQLQLASERYNNKVFYLALLRATGTMRTQALSQPAEPPSNRP
jgi:outer membrane protein TolC